MSLLAGFAAERGPNHKFVPLTCQIKANFDSKRCSGACGWVGCRGRHSKLDLSDKASLWYRPGNNNQ